MEEQIGQGFSFLALTIKVWQRFKYFGQGKGTFCINVYFVRNDLFRP